MERGVVTRFRRVLVQDRSFLGHWPPIGSNPQARPIIPIWKSAVKKDTITQYSQTMARFICFVQEYILGQNPSFSVKNKKCTDSDNLGKKGRREGRKRFYGRYFPRLPPLSFPFSPPPPHPLLGNYMISVLLGLLFLGTSTFMCRKALLVCTWKEIAQITHM